VSGQRAGGGPHRTPPARARDAVAREGDRHRSLSRNKLIVIGLIAHTCVEATVRFAVELGYEVTLVKDATADYSEEEMHAALDVNLPNYASAIVTTDEVLDSILLPSVAG